MIINLINLFPIGPKVKQLVNSVLAEQSSSFDLIGEIISVRNKILFASNDMERSSWELIAVKLIKKYFLLIAVGIYLHTTQNNTQKKLTFFQWMNQNTSIYELYRSIIPQYISQYLNIDQTKPVPIGDEEVRLGTAGYLNIHNLLLLQHASDDCNDIVSKSIALSYRSKSLQTKEKIIGLVYTKYTNIAELMKNHTSPNSQVFLLNIHRSPSL